MLPMVRRNWFGSTFDEPVARLRGEVDTLFDRFVGGDGGSLTQAWGGVPVAMWEDDDHIFIEAELPGATDKAVDAENVRARLVDGLLSIELSKSPQAKPKKVTVVTNQAK